MKYHLTDPFDLVRFLFHPPQNTWGCSVPLKTLEVRAITWPIRAGWEQSILWQNVRDAISWSPTALICIMWLAHHPVFTAYNILDSSLTLFSVPLWGEVQCWLCCTLEIPLLAKTGSCFLPTRFLPVQSLLSPVALGWVIHMESQVDRPCSPGHIPDSSLPRADSFSWERKLKFGFKAHTFFLLSKEVYLDL